MNDQDKNPEVDFSFETAACGRIEITRLKGRHLKELDFAAETSQFIDNLIVQIGRTSDGSPLSDDDVSTITSFEKEDFSEKYLQRNEYLFRDEKKDTRPDGHRQKGRYLGYGDVKVPRREGETGSAYVHRLFLLQNQRRKEVFERISAPLRRMSDNMKLFSSPLQNALKNAQSASAKLGEALHSVERRGPAGPTPTIVQALSATPVSPIIELIDLPENPVYETNRRLSEVSARLEGLESMGIHMAATVKSVSDAASQFLIDFQIASSDAARTAKTAIGIAGFAVFVTVSHIMYTVWQSAENDRVAAEAIGLISQQIDRLIITHREGAAALGEGLSASNDSTMDSLKELTITVNALAGFVRELSESARRSDGPSAQPLDSE